MKGNRTKVQMTAKVTLQAPLSCLASSSPASPGVSVALGMGIGERAVTLEEYEMLPGERQFL